MSIKVRDFMSTPVTVAMMEDDIHEIRTLMKENGIHAVPIVSYTNDTIKVDETIKGIITSTDIQEVSADATIEDVMTKIPIHVIHVDASVKSAAKAMLKNHVHHLVVMEDGEIKGMISSLDFVKLVAEHSLE